MHPIDPGIWTPKIVGDELLEAVRWANRSAGRIGPARIRSSMSGMAALGSDPDFDGWPPMADDPPRPMRRVDTPQRISQFERTIEWQMRYLKDEPGAARVLRHWVRAKLTKGWTFGQAIRHRGWSRPTAYRARDKALATIAMGLTADGIEHGQH